MSASYILSEALDIFYCITDLDGKIIKANESFVQYASHISPVYINDVIANEKEVASYLEQVNKAKKSSPLPVRVYTFVRQKTGANHYILWNAFVIADEINFAGFQVYDLNSKDKIKQQNSVKLLNYTQHTLNHKILNETTSKEGLLKILINEYPNDKLIKEVDGCNTRQKKELLSLTEKINREL
jgi:hypothetical protein